MPSQRDSVACITHAHREPHAVTNAVLDGWPVCKQASGSRLALPCALPRACLHKMGSHALAAQRRAGVAKHLLPPARDNHLGSMQACRQGTEHAVKRPAHATRPPGSSSPTPDDGQAWRSALTQLPGYLVTDAAAPSCDQSHLAPQGVWLEGAHWLRRHCRSPGAAAVACVSAATKQMRLPATPNWVNGAMARQC